MNYNSDQIKPHIVPRRKSKCKVISEWDQFVRSGTAIGSRSMVSYLDRNGEVKIMTKLVKWSENGR